MIWSVIPTGADSPHVRAEDQHGEQKKDACDFQPKRAANLGERPQEARNAAAQSVTGAARDLAGLSVDYAG